MKNRKRGNQVTTLIGEVEVLAKRLRADIRKRARAAGLPKRLQAAAGQLRKRAAAAAGLVEKYAHALRKELEASGKPAARPRANKRKSAVVV